MRRLELNRASDPKLGGNLATHEKAPGAFSVQGPLIVMLAVSLSAYRSAPTGQRKCGSHPLHQGGRPRRFGPSLPSGHSADTRLTDSSSRAASKRACAWQGSRRQPQARACLRLARISALTPSASVPAFSKGCGVSINLKRRLELNRASDPKLGGNLATHKKASGALSVQGPLIVMQAVSLSAYRSA